MVGVLNRKARSEKCDFATRLEKLGFYQIGDSTFCGKTIKIFKTNRTKNSKIRYWQIQDLSSGKSIFSAHTTSEIMMYLSQNQFLVNGCVLKIGIKH